jgi:Protein of unknown function (DUF2892)
MKMERNVGMIDRVLRFVVGCALIGFAWFYVDIPYSFLGWVGAIPVLTSIFGICPLYSMLGFSTCETRLPGPGAR